MAFGVVHWLVSFAIFLVILIIISWSALHLGAKSQNFTDVGVRFLDIDDRSIQGENKLLSSSAVADSSSTSRVMESTDGPTEFANQQGLEISDSAEFYKIANEAISFQNRDVSITQDYTTMTLFIRAAVSSDATWTEDTTTVAAYKPSDKSPAPDNSRNTVAGETTKLSNSVPQTVRPAARAFDVDSLRESELYRRVGTEPDYLHQNGDRDKTLDVSLAFSFVPISFDDKNSDTTAKRAEMKGDVGVTRPLRIPQDESPFATTISPRPRVAAHDVATNL